MKNNNKLSIYVFGIQAECKSINIYPGIAFTLSFSITDVQISVFLIIKHILFTIWKVFSTELYTYWMILLNLTLKI